MSWDVLTIDGIFVVLLFAFAYQVVRLRRTRKRLEDTQALVDSLLDEAFALHAGMLAKARESE